MSTTRIGRVEPEQTFDLRDRDEAEVRATLERFTELAGHDLRGPLATVATAVGTLQHRLHDADPDTVELLRLARRGVDKLDRMLEDLLAYARAGKLHGEHVVVDLATAVAAAASHAPGLELVPTTLPKVLGDPVLVEHLFTNLFTNVVNHVRRTTTPRARVDAWEANGRWHLSVCDNGPGITPADRERVLQPFERASHGAGIGLGLALVNRIVEAHDGELSIVDSPMGGACFRFSLPSLPD